MMSIMENVHKIQLTHATLVILTHKDAVYAFLTWSESLVIPFPNHRGYSVWNNVELSASHCL